MVYQSGSKADSQTVVRNCNFHPILNRFGVGKLITTTDPRKKLPPLPVLPEF